MNPAFAQQLSALAAIAIARGWASLPAPPRYKKHPELRGLSGRAYGTTYQRLFRRDYRRVYMRQRRSRWYAAGLNSRGLPRKPSGRPRKDAPISSTRPF